MLKTLTSQEVAALKKDGTWRVDRGLYLQIREEGATRSWLFRFRANGRVRWMGLGSARDVKLTEARGLADDARRQLRNKVDPIDQRRAERRPASITFADATEEYIKAHEAGWSSVKHSHQVRAHLETYAYPVFGKRMVDHISMNDVVKVVEPLWHAKHETGTRVRARIEAVLDWAKSAGYRTGDNPAAWKAGLQHRLPPTSRVAKVEHHAAVPWPDAPAVYARLAAIETMPSKALRFIALTGVRYAEAVGATWNEFDLDAEVPVWTVPGERMKGRKPHRVPLAAPTVALLRSLRPGGAGLVFRGTKVRTIPVSDTRLRSLLREVCDVPDVTTHGWRSTLRDWAAEATTFPPMVAEAALNHTLGSRVEVSYLRTDLFDQRAKLMTEWAAYLSHPRWPTLPTPTYGPNRASRDKH